MNIAFTRLHYGSDYLHSVIRSALPFVDKYIILYTSTSTFGRTPSIPCPDSREQLLTIALSAFGNDGHKMEWHDDLTPETGNVLKLYPDADMALELDADEIIHPWLFEQILEDLRDGNLTEYCYRLPFWHHWRSFRYVCEDSGWPARLYLPRHAKADPVFYGNPQARVHHFGYARSASDMRYKWECSMHANEIRADWWTEIWGKFPDRLHDLHPTNPNFWDAQKLDMNCLPDVLRGHPYEQRLVIE